MSNLPEYGWLIEANNSEVHSPVYFAGLIHSDRPSGETIDFMWTSNHLDAARFSRKSDAEAVAGNYKHRIAEHAWDDGEFRRSYQLKE